MHIIFTRKKLHIDLKEHLQSYLKKELSPIIRQFLKGEILKLLPEIDRGRPTLDNR